MANPIAGQMVRIKNTDPAHTGFQDSTGTLIDPTTVQLIYKDPTGTITTLTYPTGIVRETTGVYHYDVDTTGKSGNWLFAWKSTGTGQAYAWNAFTVDPAPL